MFLVYLPKIHILSFLTHTLFARFLRDTLFFSLKMRKKGLGRKIKDALGPLDQ